MNAISVSPDGSKAAYATSASGSDWLTWHVRDVDAGADLDDTLPWCKSERAEWESGSSGFYYAAMTPPRPGREYQDATTAERIFFHRAGTAQHDDELVFAPANAALHPDVTVSADGRYLVLSLSRGIGPGGGSLFLPRYRALTTRAVNVFIRGAVNTGHNVRFAGL